MAWWSEMKSSETKDERLAANLMVPVQSTTYGMVPMVVRANGCVSTGETYFLSNVHCTIGRFWRELWIGECHEILLRKDTHAFVSREVRKDARRH
jgi:hypothetical protein